MKVRSSNAFWLLKNGLIKTYPSLREDMSCDILVVGGGITGALLGFQLSSEGYETILIDREDVAFGSTSASTAMLQYELDRPLCALMDSLGSNIAVDVYKAGVEAIQSIGALVARTGIECGFKVKDSIYIARKPNDLNWLSREFETRRTNGLDVYWLSADDLSRRYAVAGLGAIRSTVGANLDSYRFAHGLLSYSSHHYNLQVFDHTALVGVSYSGDRAEARTDSGHTISTRWIVYATGYETQGFMKEKIVNLLSTYVCISEPMDRLPAALESSIYWTTDSPYLYIRSTSDKRVLIGGEDEPFVDGERRDQMIDKKEVALLGRLREIMPDLSFTPDFSWAGTFGVTRDSLPYVGPHPDFPKSHFVLGYGGNGITFSVVAMKVISDAIAGRPNRFLDYFRFNRY